MNRQTLAGPEVLAADSEHALRDENCDEIRNVRPRIDPPTDTPALSSSHTPPPPSAPSSSPTSSGDSSVDTASSPPPSSPIYPSASSPTPITPASALVDFFSSPADTSAPLANTSCSSSPPSPSPSPSPSAPPSPSPSATQSPSPSPSLSPSPPPSPVRSSDLAKIARAFIMGMEGGYANHPNDHGGATMQGVTHKTYDMYRDFVNKPRQDVRLITASEHEEIFLRFYWEPVLGDMLNAPLSIAMADFAFHSGPARAIRELQSILGVTVDGIFGPDTLNAVLDYPGTPQELCNELINRREAFQLRIIARDPTQQVFQRGWHNRNESLRKQVQTYS